MKKWFTRRNALIAVFAAGVLVLLIFRNADVVKNLGVIAFLIAAALTLSVLIEKDGVRALLIAAGPWLWNLFPVLSGMGFVPYLTRAVNALLDWLPVSVPPADDTASLTAAFWLLFVLAAALGPVLFNRLFDFTAMGRKRDEGDPEFKELSFRDKNAAFCDNLVKRLDGLDHDARWDDSAYVPLEAESEVEAVIGDTRKKRYKDMLRRLQQNRKKNTVYLVLGAPGSGKSVSLRKLCRELLKEAGETKKTPVYINLKSWNVPWNAENLPERKDLEKFVKQEVYGAGTDFTDHFLNDYYQKMLVHGKWYFIFDSFDEMPCLMTGGDCRDVIARVSRLLYEFLTGPGQNGGVIASRLYNAPSEALRATETLRIQEFNADRIRATLERHMKNAAEVERALFSQRRDLVSLCRNPFYLTLMIHYLDTNNQTFPENQKELYENFVSKRLDDCAGRMELNNTTADEVHGAAKALALYMQSSHGLECPVRELLELPGKRAYWERTLYILEHARLIRTGGAEGRVSFVHRRFQEFFLVENMLDGVLPVGQAQYADILQNTGLRDALVLYAEVAAPETAAEIARFCWDAVRRNLGYGESAVSEGGMELVNALYFMTEAFQNRRDAVADFLGEFQDIIALCLEDEDADYIVQLAMVRSMALFDEGPLQRAVLTVFELNNRWLNDAVVENCWPIKQLEKSTEDTLMDYLCLPSRITLHPRRTAFSLSLSDSFRFLKVMYLGFVCMWFGWTLKLFAMPIGLYVGKISFNLSNPHFYAINLALPMDQIISIVYADLNNGLSDITLATGVVLMIICLNHYLSAYRKWPALSFSVWILASLSLFFFASVMASAHLIGGFLTSTFVLLLAAFTLVVIWIAYEEEISPLYVLCRYLVFIPFTFVYSCVYLLFLYPADIRRIRREPAYKTMERERIKNTLDAFKTNRGRAAYIQSLDKNKTTLTGEWPGGQKPKYNADVDRLLAMLDTADIDTYNYRF